VSKCPKNPRKQGCGRTPAPLFSGLYKLFRDLLILFIISRFAVLITSPDYLAADELR